MKILHLIPAFNRGGTERIVISLVGYQLMQGHEVKIFAFSELNQYQEETTDFDIETFPNTEVNYKLFRKPVSNLSRMQGQLEAFAPEIIHSHSYWTDLIIHALPKIDAHYISHLHLYYKEYQCRFSLHLGSLKKWVGLRLLFSAFHKRNTRFIAVSNDVSRYYQDWLPSSLSRKISVLPNFLGFEPERKTNQPTDEIKLLSIGRLVQVKNHTFLLNVARRLMDLDIPFHLTIAGDGPERAHLENQKINLELSNHVDLIGIVSDVEKIYKANHIYLHASFDEPFGLTILEAMAFGLPCVVCDIEGPKDIITKESEGIFVKANDEEAFVEAILRLKNDPSYYTQLTIGAYNRSLAFSLPQYADKLMKIYIGS